MRNASAAKPLRPSTEEHAEDHRVLGLGLDADAVGALDVAADDRPADADDEHEAGGVADERVGAVDVAVEELHPLRQLVVDLEHGGDREQDQEREVDQRVHEPGGGVAQQGLHVDAGAEVAEAPLRRLRVRVPPVGGAPLPVLDAVGEQHAAVDEDDGEHRVEAELPRGRDVLEDLALHRRVVEPPEHERAEAGADGEQRPEDAEADDEVVRSDPLGHRRETYSSGIWAMNCPGSVNEPSRSDTRQEDDHST